MTSHPPYQIPSWSFFLKQKLRRSLSSLGRNDWLHIQHRGHIELPESFQFDESRAAPRGKPDKAGKYFSFDYSPEYTGVPASIRELVLNYRTIIESYFSCPVIIRKPNIFRNIHISRTDEKAEYFSEFWHQDTVGVLQNLQIMVLMSDVSEKHGPFEYLSPQTQSEYYRKNTKVTAQRIREIPGVETLKFTGKRGDTILVSSGYTLHRATSPEKGLHRDMMSLAFYPYFADNCPDGISFEKLNEIHRSLSS